MNQLQFKILVNRMIGNKTKKEFCAKACELGMTEAFFSEFFKRFEHGIQYERRTQPEMLSFAFSNMIGKSKHWTGVAMVDQKSAASDALVKNSSAAVFTEEIFTRQLFYDILGKLPVILPVIILILFLSVFFSLRSWIKTCLVCLPIASCIAGIAGIHGLLGEEITLAVVVAGIITIGISVDYGVLLVTSNLSPHNSWASLTPIS